MIPKTIIKEEKTASLELLPQLISRLLLAISLRPFVMHSLMIVGTSRISLATNLLVSLRGCLERSILVVEESGKEEA